jgi:hypothetical protein
LSSNLEDYNLSLLLFEPKAFSLRILGGHRENKCSSVDIVYINYLFMLNAFSLSLSLSKPRTK